MPVDPDAEIRALRTVVRDLVALSAMPAAWIGREPAAVAAGLADVLTGLLQLDFVYVRLCVPSLPEGAVEITRGTARKSFPEWLDTHLAKSGQFSGKTIISDVDGGAAAGRGVVIPVGVNAEGGVVAAASDRTGFPTEIDELLLCLAANHAATVFQSTRLKEHRAQMWFLESTDRIDRAIQGTSDLEQMMGDVLDAVLVTFGCDRAWLVYPCDPDADSYRLAKERARPEYVGAFHTDGDVPNEPGVASVFGSVLASRSPVRFDSESGLALSAGPWQRFSIKSMIAMAVCPKVDEPYLFALHQCSYARTWTPQEERLFHEIGRRLADALDTLLMFRNLRESERKLERSRAELAASRARIVATADNTRRRIERDLHDGAQQRLVFLALQLRAAQAAVPPGAAELAEELAQVATELTGALDELREVAHGIHPAVLAEGGLRPALNALVGHSAMPVRLDVRVPARLPEPVEVAAYYVVSEALTNSAKHARASAAHVAVDAHDGVLEVSIRDDGCGGADPTRGTGLIGLTDRVDALGGTIDVASPVGQGTTLSITFPIDG